MNNNQLTPDAIRKSLEALIPLEQALLDAQEENGERIAELEALLEQLRAPIQEAERALNQARGEIKREFAQYDSVPKNPYGVKLTVDVAQTKDTIAWVVEHMPAMVKTIQWSAVKARIKKDPTIPHETKHTISIPKQILGFNDDKD